MSAAPELKKKKIARDAELLKKSNAAVAEKAKSDLALATEITAKAKKYEEEYEALAKAAIDNRRNAKANNSIYVAPEEKVVFVIRIRGIIGISPKVRKILQLLRLRQLHNGVFVRVNAATTKMLRLVEPFIAYGYPNLKSVKELIYKRGFGKVSGQRVPLSTNEIVQAGLGGDFKCVEDVIHEIYTCGPKFKEAANFLWPFKMASPKGGFIGKKLNHHNEDGACGQHGVKINRLIKKML